MATVDTLDWTRAIARGAGAGIGAITNIFTVTATYTTETSDSSTHDTSMIGKDIKTVMAVNFRVE